MKHRELAQMGMALVQYSFTIELIHSHPLQVVLLVVWRHIQSIQNHCLPTCFKAPAIARASMWS